MKALHRLSFRRTKSVEGPLSPVMAARRTGMEESTVDNSSKPPPPPSPAAAQQSPTAVSSWPKQGDYVMAKLDDWNSYYGGEVKKVNPETDSFDILFDDGERQRSVPRSMLKKPSETPKSNMKSGHVSFAPNTATRFQEGDRVSCKISGWNSWYDGYVTALNPDGTYVVSFDDGEKVSTVREKEIMAVTVEFGGAPPSTPKGVKVDYSKIPDYVRVGSRIEAKCAGWHKFYIGTVQAISPGKESCSIVFDDGELKEGVTAEFIRAARTMSQARLNMNPEQELSSSKFRVGTRVMANPFGEWTKAYPGRIERTLNDGTFAVLFDDGERVAGVSAEDMDVEASDRLQSEGPSMEIEDEDLFQPGQHVEAKVGQWRKFYPGTIRKANPDGTYIVDFVDGEVMNNVTAEEMRRSRQRAETSQSEITVNPTSPDQVYHVGERIAAKLFIEQKWRKFWGGEVVKCNDDGSYKIIFDDGEVYGSVWPAEMKRPKPGSALAAPIHKPALPEALDVGERVEAKTGNWKSWYPGIIEKNNNDNTYAIQFDDGERLLHVQFNEIRRLIKVRRPPGDDESDDGQ